MANVTKEGWYKLPYTDYDIPMPPKDLFIALVTVLMFLPAIVIVNRLLLVFSKPKAKRD